MAHRSRSRTADSTDTKKSKGTPRRLTEKIAIMKRREHEQSEAFEQAMKSIFEMQRARIHSGGGSMPSLQAIDSTPPPSIDMQSVFKDFKEVKQHGSGTFKERPHSGGPGGRLMGIDRRTNTCETDPYPTIGLGHSDHYWNASPEWMEGDLSRHKSDSDLQQSLVMQTSPQHVLSFQFGSPPQVSRNHKLSPPGDLGLWRRPNSMSAALLSPDQYSNPDGPLSAPLGATGGASSLPDLTNIEFSSGLDVPIERDDLTNEQPVPRIGTYHSPTVASKGPGPGPSKLIFSSMQAQPVGNALLPNMFPPPPHYPPNMMHPSYDLPNTNFGLRQQPQLAQYSVPPNFGGVRKSPTMPEFQTSAHPVNSFAVPQMSNPQFRPILPSYPNTDHLSTYRPPAGTVPPFVPQATQVNPNTPPPMTIIIQPPISSQQPLPPPQMQQAAAPPTQPLNSVNPLPSNIGNGTHLQHHANVFTMPESPNKSISSGTSLPNTPTITISSSLPHPHNLLTTLGNLPVLPSYLEAKQQQALQHKFASINVGKSEPLVRSHSEENLQKAQKEKGDMTHNPFMGNLANANSVPCVYVDTDQPVERSDSPTTVDSPSTSASYASSPPSVRPFWVDHPHTMNDYVFHEWPLEGGAEKARPGSPPIHHKSLTDLSTIPEVAEGSPNTRSKSLLHQLSLPSIVMGDLTVDEQTDKQNSPTFMSTDYDMEEAVMDSLLKEDVPDLQPFGVNFMGPDTLMSSSPDSFLHNRLQF